MTYKEVMNYGAGYFKRSEDEWKRARFIAFYSIIPHAKKGKIKKPEDLLKLPSEAIIPTMSKQEREVKAKEVLKKMDPSKYEKIYGKEY